METELDLGVLEREVGVWADDNFGDQPASYPLIGAGEEQGENTRSVLKQLQGIGESDKYEQRDDVGTAAEQDAIGDIIIYLADFFHRCDDASLENVDVRRGRVEYDRSDEIVLDMYAAYGNICRSHRSGDPNGIEFGTSMLLSRIFAFCEERGYDFDQCVLDAWDEVSDREWDAEITHA